MTALSLDQLAEIARNKKQEFKKAQFAGESMDNLQELCDEYGKAIAVWHKIRFPGKKAPRPSLASMMRMI